MLEPQEIIPKKVAHAEKLGQRFKDVGPLQGVLSETIWALDPLMPVPEIVTFDRLIAASVAGPRLRSFLFGSLGSLGLLVALLGIGGLLMCVVRSRKREFGVRIALGGASATVRWMVVRYALRLTLLGVVIGWGVTLGSGRLLESLLFEVSASDPAVGLGAAVLITCIALLAADLPARVATRVEPTEALRDE